jgi:hypothetical protein
MYEKVRKWEKSLFSYVVNAEFYKCNIPIINNNSSNNTLSYDGLFLWMGYKIFWVLLYKSGRLEPSNKHMLLHVLKLHRRIIQYAIRWLYFFASQNSNIPHSTWIL